MAATETAKGKGTEAARIEDQLHKAFHGGAWHGPALSELLAGVTAQQAAAHPIPGAHSIWEIVNHVGAWASIVVRRLGGEAVNDVSDAEDWPGPDGASRDAWETARRRLFEEYDVLGRAIASLDEGRLADRVPGREYTAYVMLHGAVQHALYHAGQIALLKRAATSV